MRKSRKHFDDETEVDMTPMLDIVFIMLIFFIVATSFVKEDGIILNRPAKNQNQDNQDTKNTPILIVLDGNGDIRVKNRLIDVGAVRANVEAEKAKKPNAAVVVQVHEDAESGILVSIVDQARLAGAEKVIVAKPAK